MRRKSRIYGFQNGPPAVSINPGKGLSRQPSLIRGCIQDDTFNIPPRKPRSGVEAWGTGLLPKGKGSAFPRRSVGTGFVIPAEAGIQTL